MLTVKEMESVTTVFRSFESGLRGATIDPSVSYAFKSDMGQKYFKNPFKLSQSNFPSTLLGFT